MTDNIDKITDDLIKNYKTKKFKDALVQADILSKHKIKFSTEIIIESSFRFLL